MNTLKLFFSSTFNISQFNEIEPLLKELETSITEVSNKLAVNIFTSEYKWKGDHMDLHKKVSEKLPTLHLNDDELNIVKSNLELSQICINKFVADNRFFQGKVQNISDIETRIFLFLNLNDHKSIEHVSKRLQQQINEPKTKNCLLSNEVAKLNGSITIPQELGITKGKALVKQFGNEHCKAIEILNLKGFSTLDLENICNSLLNLKKMTLHDSVISENDASNLSMMKTLEDLTLNNCKDYSPEPKGKSRRFHRPSPKLDCTYFQELNALKTVCITNDRHISITWPVSSSIEHLVINCSDQQFNNIEFVKSFPSLKSLSLNDSLFLRDLENMEEKDMEEEIKKLCPQFEILKISDRKDGIENIPCD